MLHRRFSFVVVFVALSVAACSSTSSSGAVGANAAAFSAYCTGTLSAESAVGYPYGPEGWMNEGERVPAGTTVHVARGFKEGEWGAFVLGGDKPGKIFAENGGEKLLLDKDFTSDCARAAARPASGAQVVLAEAKLYAKEDLSGEACVLTAGTELAGYFAYVRGQGDVGTVATPLVKERCGVDSAYTNDLVTASLVKK